MAFRIGFCVSGEGRLFQSAVKHRETIIIDPVLLVTHQQASSSLSVFAKEKGIEHSTIPFNDRDQFGDHLTKLCLSRRLDLLVLTFDRILPESVLQQLPNKIINVHMSLLPAFKGLSALPKVIQSGVKYAGASIHEIDNTVDGGSIIAQCIASVSPQETPESIGKKLYTRLEPMFLQTLEWYAAGRVLRDDQNRLWIKDGKYEDGFICPRLENNIHGLFPQTCDK